MMNTPRSLRLHLLFAGRMNSGKSTLVNLISGQDTAIISPEPGTTTDVVEKSMEIRPLGPVVLLDSAGTDDLSQLGAQRVERTFRALDKADVLIIVTSPGNWGETEQNLLAAAQQRKIPALTVINYRKGGESCGVIAVGIPEIAVNAADTSAENRDAFLRVLVKLLLEILPEENFADPPLLRDLLPQGGHVVMMVPIDTQAPRGRLILPQVQAIRDALDGECICTVAKETAFPAIYENFKQLPDLIVCDSQAVKTMIETAPPGVICTTFSILMARLKGDLTQLVAGAEVIRDLRDGDRVLIAEACTHHAGHDDIGRVKIPALLQKKSGRKLEFVFYSGSDFPSDLADFALVVHCGGCMLNRRAMLNRLNTVANAGVPVVNYGVCISACTGVLDKVVRGVVRD